jgi:hypothetical protein
MIMMKVPLWSEAAHLYKTQAKMFTVAIVVKVSCTRWSFVGLP